MPHRSGGQGALEPPLVTKPRSIQSSPTKTLTRKPADDRNEEGTRFTKCQINPTEKTHLWCLNAKPCALTRPNQDCIHIQGKRLSSNPKNPENTLYTSWARQMTVLTNWKPPNHGKLSHVAHRHYWDPGAFTYPAITSFKNIRGGGSSRRWWLAAEEKSENGPHQIRSPEQTRTASHQIKYRT